MSSTAEEIVAAVRRLGTGADTYGSTLNTPESPQAVRTIGEALAHALRDIRMDRILVWNSSDESVLAHVVAELLGVTVVRANTVEGIVELYPSVPAGTRIVGLATSWEERSLRTLLSVVATQDAEVVAVAAVLDTSELHQVERVPVVHLVAGDQ